MFELKKIKLRSIFCYSGSVLFFILFIILFFYVLFFTNYNINDKINILVAIILFFGVIFSFISYLSSQKIREGYLFIDRGKNGLILERSSIVLETRVINYGENPVELNRFEVTMITKLMDEQNEEQLPNLDSNILFFARKLNLQIHRIPKGKEYPIINEIVVPQDFYRYHFCFKCYFIFNITYCDTLTHHTIKKTFYYDSPKILYLGELQTAYLYDIDQAKDAIEKINEKIKKSFKKQTGYIKTNPELGQE